MDFISFLPELVMISTAIILIVIDLFYKKKSFIAFVGVVGALIAFCITLILSGSERSFTDMFVLDGYSSFFKVIFYINVIFTILISLKYMELEKASYGEYYALLLFATSGMMIMVSAADLIVLYLGLELMALSTYVLIGIIRHSIKSNEAAIKNFLLGSFSSAFLLFGISLIYGLTGTTDIEAISKYIIAHELSYNKMLLLSILLFVVAFGFKIALVPFHMWAPDSYEGAPTSITAFMSVGPKAAGLAVLGKVFMISFGSIHVEWSIMLIPLAILSMCVGNILAIAQTNIKRMLAYSSIAHAGYALLGIICGTREGLTSMMNYMFIYALMNIGAFTVIIMLRSEKFKGEELDDYEGLSKTHPLAALLMLIFMFSLAGIPPTAGFIGKFYVFMEVIEAGKLYNEARYLYLVIIAVIFSVVSAYFYLRVVIVMYMKEPKNEVILTNSVPIRITLLITAILVIILGIAPSYLLKFAGLSILG